MLVRARHARAGSTAVLTQILRPAPMTRPPIELRAACVRVHVSRLRANAGGARGRPRFFLGPCAVLPQTPKMNRKERRAAANLAQTPRSYAPAGTRGGANFFRPGLAHHQAGRLAEAEALYRQAIAVEPSHAD